MAETSSNRFVRHLRSNKIAYVVGAITVMFAFLINHLSYSRSVMLTLPDVWFCVEEGLVSFKVPLVRIPAESKPNADFVIYERKEDSWKAGEDSRFITREFLLSSDAFYTQQFADFGYCTPQFRMPGNTGTKNQGRLIAAKFIVLFAPIWFVFFSIYGIFFVFYRGWIRFRLRTLFIVTTVFAGLFWLLMLRAPG